MYIRENVALLSQSIFISPHLMFYLRLINFTNIYTPLFSKNILYLQLVVSEFNLPTIKYNGIEYRKY